MPFSRRYGLFLVVPPLVLLLPIALLFLFHVTQMSDVGRGSVTVIAAIAYLVGGGAAIAALERTHRSFVADVIAERDVAASMSAVLIATTRWAASLWIGVGVALAFAGWAFLHPTFLGLQYFVEAALIVAAPAMAWSYWAGKEMILRGAAKAPVIAYTGRVWPVRTKIAIVFIGFFFVSVGALVLVVSSRIARQVGEEAAYEIAGFAFLLAIGTTIVFGLATWFLGRDITSPMTELVRLAEQMARGELTSEPRIFADDEIGVVARGFSTTRQNLRTLMSRVGERGQTITTGVRSMLNGTDLLVQNAQEQSGQAGQSSAALLTVQGEAQSVLEEVDRVASVAHDSAQRTTELRASFSEVRRRMDQLFQSVEQSSTAANEIDAAARESARRASALETIGADVLAFVTQMDATVEQITRTVDSTAAISTRVRDNANGGRRAVEATVEGIRLAQDSTRRTSGAFESLQRSLKQIDQILLFIDEVTNQTNLLSLNAGIIAAQAGKNDYGFSVIAEEIRQLADRTRNATKEISGIVRDLKPVARQAMAAIDEGVESVDRTVVLARNAASALDVILGSADTSLEMTQSISRAMVEQAKASRHLHSVTAEMSQTISEMRRSSEGQAESTRLLAVEAERVSEIAMQVNRATAEQTAAVDGIAASMEQVAGDVSTIRDRLDRQLHQAEQIAGASRVTLEIAKRNNGIAEQFRDSLSALVRSGNEFHTEVGRFRT